MKREDREWVLQVIKMEIEKIKPPRPVEVDIDKIVKLVLDKVAIASVPAYSSAAEKASFKSKKE